LPLANPSHCRADSGLSPYRTCAHRAHTQKSRLPWSGSRDFMIHQRNGVGSSPYSDSPQSEGVYLSEYV
jgi:hypothetical protein